MASSDYSPPISTGIHADHTGRNADHTAFHADHKTAELMARSLDAA
jgi:hypothetical protein